MNCLKESFGDGLELEIQTSGPRKIAKRAFLVGAILVGIKFSVSKITDKTTLRVIRRIGGGERAPRRNLRSKRTCWRRAAQERKSGLEEKSAEQEEDMLAPRGPATEISSPRASTHSAGIF